MPGRLQLWSVTACERQRATLLLWRGAEPTGQVVAAPYRCHSWRCRRCAWQVAADDFRRLTAAALSRGWWVYVVLTFEPERSASHWSAYQAAGGMWDKRLRRQLERRYGRLEYVQTWERHRSGWPHVNLLMRSDRLQEHVEQLPHEHRFREDLGHGRGRTGHWTAWRRELAPLATRAGFGRRLWVELVSEPVGMAKYLGKIAREFSAAAFKPGDQRPLGAPAHFRRLRASRGILPPRARQVRRQEVDRETGEVRELVELREIGGPSEWSGCLAPVTPLRYSTTLRREAEKLLGRGVERARLAEEWGMPVSELDVLLCAREPSALDVANAWECRVRARTRGPRPARIET